jgi:hypothetical protein
MVIALAGRRIDSPDTTESRFPAQQAILVQERIRKLLKHNDATDLVCSAACGADLLALEIAGKLGIRRHIVLPFARDIFRRTSVSDRPGNWGERYDCVLDEVERDGELVLLGLSEDGPAAFATANITILERAIKLARKDGQPLLGVVVWDGRSRGHDDLTEQFLNDALDRHLDIVQVSTLD